MSEWNSMDTAPKGGGADLVTDPEYVKPPLVLLLFPADKVSVAYWDWYYAEGGNGCTDGVAWIEPISSEPLHMYYEEPIGWLPLP
jgi:hypothetical protein